jgi:hypothetical protein
LVIECDWISFDPLRMALSISELAVVAVAGRLDINRGSIFE